MTVIDIRNIFSDRRIDLVDVNSSYIYYAEEKNEENHNDLYILEYNRKTRKERLITNYTLDDPTFIYHIFAFDKTIVLVLENGGNSLWMIEIEKKSGGELNRRKVVCTGSFKNCIALDSDHILIFMAPDDISAEIFAKYKEVTGCDSLCYLYNVKTNQKYFVKSPLIAKIGCENIKKLSFGGQNYLVLAEPFSDESVKEAYYQEQRWVNTDVRDNVWLCKTEELEREIENGSDSITKKCIASADIKALVRYMGINDSKIFFRAKEFRTKLEKLCSYDIATETLAVEATLEPPKDNTVYVVEENPFHTFAVKIGKVKTSVKGIVCSEADIAFDNELGTFMTCFEDRYCVMKTNTDDDGKSSHSSYCLYDPTIDQHETYECSCYAKDDTLILY